MYFGTLSGGLGCFPLDHGPYHPWSDCRAPLTRHSQFDHTQYTGMAPSYVQCSTSVSHRPTLALKLFRGEPAISRFDWNFSATHKSSPPFSADVWFGPPWDFTPTSTCSWVGHLVSGLLHATIALFRLGFPSAPNLQFLTSHCIATRRFILQKARHHPLTGSDFL